MDTLITPRAIAKVGLPGGWMYTRGRAIGFRDAGGLRIFDVDTLMSGGAPESTFELPWPNQSLPPGEIPRDEAFTADLRTVVSLENDAVRARGAIEWEWRYDPPGDANASVAISSDEKLAWTVVHGDVVVLDMTDGTLLDRRPLPHPIRRADLAAFADRIAVTIRVEDGWQCHWCRYSGTAMELSEPVLPMDEVVVAVAHGREVTVSDRFVHVDGKPVAESKPDTIWIHGGGFLDARTFLGSAVDEGETYSHWLIDVDGGATRGPLTYPAGLQPENPWPLGDGTWLTWHPWDDNRITRWAVK